MALGNITALNSRPAGYVALCAQFRLKVIPNWHRSWVAANSARRIQEVAGGAVDEVYPASYWPGAGRLGDHLEFALKYDGVNLGILASLFRVIPTDELTEHIRAKPLGRHARRLWFLYEFLTGQRLPLEDLARGNYVDLLDPEEHYAAAPARQERRHRVNDNLLGDARFCPVVRRSEALKRYEAADFPGRCRKLASAYPPELLRRALGYLYTRETKSSFEIEGVSPDANRAGRFVALLELAEREDFCDRDRLMELQNRIVDERFRDSDWRRSQNYVGETVAWQRERVHFVGPKPEDLPDLMAGWFAAARRMAGGNVPAAVHAAAAAYGFVFLHPFEDGNGRIHRFLIHNILSRRGFTPAGIMFPVSAAMLRDRAGYDASLEAFSRPLLPLVEYSLDGDGRMTVSNDTALWYRCIDLTAQTEALFGFIERTIEIDLAAELKFLASYDRTRTAIKEVVDMPDRLVDLFIRICLENGGRLSARKRESLFALLKDEEVKRMETAVGEGYGEQGRKAEG